MKKNSYDNNRVKRWRSENPDKVKAGRIRCAFRLLRREGVIDGERVIFDPTK